MRMRRKTKQKTKQKRKPTPVSIRAGQVEFVKVNTDAWRWRDVYRWLLGLSWPQFAGFVASLYVGLNVLFAALWNDAGQIWRQLDGPRPVKVKTRARRACCDSDRALILS